MTSIQSLKQMWQEKPARFFAWLLAAVTLIRIAGLFTSNLNLGPDEAQYWWWSREFAFGYFSKPPMIAWLIGATTSIFGNDEWAVRLSSPLCAAVTGWFIFLTARRLYDDRTALWAGITWITVPAIMMATTILSTDVPLLMFWAIGLYAFVRLCEETDLSVSWRWGLLLGAALGFGMLSKYAMMYFPAGMALAFILSGRARKALQPVPLIIAFAVAAAVFAPNVLWNAGHGNQTLKHTQENAGWGGNLFHPDELLEFFTSQFFVAGPILFGFLLFGLATAARRVRGTEAGSDLTLIGFAVPPLAIILFQATISGANANWAMAAYPAAIILVVAWMLRAGRMRLLKGSLAFHIIVGVIGLLGLSNFAIMDMLGLSNSIKRVRDWPEQIQEIAAYAEDYPVVVVDDRELMGNVLYYMRDSGKPVKAIDTNRHIDNGYEAFDLYDGSQYDRALLIAKYPQYTYTYVEYDNIIELGETSRDTGVECPRRYFLFELSGYDPSKNSNDIPPQPEDFSRKIDGCRPY